MRRRISLECVVAIAADLGRQRRSHDAGMDLAGAPAQCRNRRRAVGPEPRVFGGLAGRHRRWFGVAKSHVGNTGRNLGSAALMASVAAREPGAGGWSLPTSARALAGESTEALRILSVSGAAGSAL